MDLNVAKRIGRRPATEADTEFARTTHYLAYYDVVVRQFGDWDEDKQKVFFQGDWHPHRCEILSFDGQPCGYISVEKHSDHIDVREIVILPNYQGKGIGSEILRTAMNLARSRKQPVKLCALHCNRAIELYKRYGFKEIGQTSTHTLFTWQDFETDSLRQPTE